MRRFFAVLVLLLLASTAAADVVAGNEWMIFHDLWVPLGGGNVEPLPRKARSAAFDGNRFLMGWRDGDIVWLALIDEGADIPWTYTSLGVPGTKEPIIRWDGTRYVILCEGEPTHIAIASRQGIVERLYERPSLRNIVDAAASPSGLALLAQTVTGTHAAVLDALLLDPEFQSIRRLNVGSISRSSGSGTTYIESARIAPFGTSFFAAWREGRTGRHETVVGTRVMLDGTAPDTRPSTRERDSRTGMYLSNAEPHPVRIAVHPYGPRLAVQPIREWGSGITTTLVDPDGNARETTHRLALGIVPPPAIETVQFADRSIAAVYVRNGIAVVRMMLGPPASVRRRSSQH